MLYLILAFLVSAAMSIVIRLSKEKTSNEYVVLACNYGTCVLCGSFFVGTWDLTLEGGGTVVLMGLIVGIIFMLSLNLQQKNIFQNGVVLTTIFTKLAVFIPTLLSIFLFGETPNACQVVGLVLVFVSVIVINERPGSSESQIAAGSKKNMALLLLLMLVSGLSSSGSKIYNHYCNPLLGDLYLVIVFGAAGVCAVIFAILSHQKTCINDCLFGCLVGICNYFCTRFLFYALQSLPAVIVYPVYCMGGIAVLTLAGILFFKEKLSRNQAIGLGLASVSLLLLNL